MTKQEAYLKIRTHFSRSDAQLAKSDDGCYYRHPETGAACAVGCLIPDKLYEAFGPVGYEDDDYYDEDGGGERAPANQLEEKVLVGLINYLRHETDSADANAILDIVNGEGEENREKIEFLAKAQKLHDSVAINAPDFVRMLDVLAWTEGLSEPTHGGFFTLS